MTANIRNVLESALVGQSLEYLFSNQLSVQINIKSMFTFSKLCRRTQKSECSFNDNNLPWFDDDCRIKRQEFYHLLNLYRSDKTDENRINMVSARRSFKKALRKARFRYDSDQCKKLNDLRYNNAKEYWKLLR